MSLKRRNKPNGRNICVKVFEPQPLRMARISWAEELPTTRVAFHVPTPDGRVQVKIALIVAPDVGTLSTVPEQASEIPFNVLGSTAPYPVTARLWLCVRECDENTGLYLPTVNLVGTRSAPQVIPLDVDLMAFSWSGAPDGDEVYGELELTVDPGETPDSRAELDWWINTKYTPIVEMCQEEWGQLVAAFTPQREGADIVGVSPPPEPFEVGPFEDTIDLTTTDLQFFEIAGGPSVPTSPGLIPDAGTLVQVVIDIPDAVGLEFHMEIWKNGVDLGGGWSQVVPVGGPYGLVTFTGSEPFNGTSDVLDFVVYLMVAGESGNQEIHATATFLPP